MTTTSVYVILTVIAFAIALLALYPLMGKGLSRRRAVLIAGMFVALCLGIYRLVGNPDAVLHLEAEALKRETLATEIQITLDKISISDKNAELWDTLSTLYAEYGDWKKAADAAKQSVILSRGNVEYILNYATALYYANDGTVSDEARKSFDMVLLLQPENEIAPYFIGLHEAQKGNTEKAKAVWEGFLARTDPASRYALLVREGLAKLR